MEKNYGLCKLSVVPVRASASDEAEIVTQLLFGDAVKILEYGEPWIKIYAKADDYEGWMDFKQLTFVDKAFYEDYIQAKHDCVRQRSIVVKGPLGKQTIMLGSNLPKLEENSFYAAGEKYQILSELEQINESITDTAKRYLNTPYLWGGKGIFGIDCSGFTQIVAKIHGKEIPRDCSEQVKVGEEVGYSERKVGDLMFFINDNQKVHHVGFLLSDKDIIHASGHVRIDQYDEKGIFRTDFNRHTHQFYSIKRI